MTGPWANRRSPRPDPAHAGFARRPTRIVVSSFAGSSQWWPYTSSDGEPMASPRAAIRVFNACRIVAVFGDEGAVSRFGFAYGTLPDHVGTGEERFLVEWDRGDDAVWYDILAFSRPNHVLTRLGYPVVRRLQKRFGRDSAAAMLRAVGSGGEVKADRSGPVIRRKF